jgi:hypothetical protein
MKSVYKITLLFGITILVSSAIIMHQTISIFQICMSTLDMIHIPNRAHLKMVKKVNYLQMDFKRGFVPYGYDNSTEGYDLAKLNSKSPLDTIS